MGVIRLSRRVAPSGVAITPLVKGQFLLSCLPLGGGKLPLSLALLNGPTLICFTPSREQFLPVFFSSLEGPSFRILLPFLPLRCKDSFHNLFSGAMLHLLRRKCLYLLAYKFRKSMPGLIYRLDFKDFGLFYARCV